MELYVSQQKSELLDSLENQVRFSQLVAVLVGAKGLGKSFLLEQLHSRLKDEVVLASVDASLAMSDDQLDKTISLQLGLRWQDSEVDIATRIVNTHTEKVLITVDDAHLLSANCLEFILKLNQSQLTEKESSLFILLAGENSLPVMINRASTFTQHPEMCVVFEIEPIQQSETKAIVETFSHPNSNVLKELKDSSRLDYFWQLAKGNPAELNYHMSRWLDQHSPTQVINVRPEAPKTILKAIVYTVLALTLSAMLIYQNDINQWISPSPEKEATSLMPKESAAGSVLELKKDKLSGEDQLKEGFGVSTEQQPEPDLVNAGEQENQSEEVKQHQAEKNQSQALIHQTTTLEDQLETSTSRKTKVEKVVSQPKNEPLSVGKPYDETTDKNKANSGLDKMTNDESVLLKGRATDFVLQWTGVSSLQAAEKYRELHIVREQMKIYRRFSNGKTLYLVVSDAFTNRALAEFALNDYMQQGVQERPWIKSLGLVQKEIRQYEKRL